MFTMPETWPFAAALAVMVGLAAIEGLGLLLSHSPSNTIDGFLPDSLGSDSLLGWLHLGRVPSLILLVLFLAGFALTGYAIQAVTLQLGSVWPAWAASIPAVIGGLAMVRGAGTWLKRVLPQDETSAISEQALIGRVGVIVRGHARAGFAAEVKVRDARGRAHYVMVEPEPGTVTEPSVFHEGSEVLLVKKVGTTYRCISNPYPKF
jgi:membrane protein implicated in regulation of membrane protease activity